MKYHYFQRYFTYSVELEAGTPCSVSGIKATLGSLDPGRRHCQVGSLAGAAHLLNDNAGVLR